MRSGGDFNTIAKDLRNARTLLQKVMKKPDLERIELTGFYSNQLMDMEAVLDRPIEHYEKESLRVCKIQQRKE